jgi:hypothetical protein
MFGWLDRAWNWAASNIGGTVVTWVRDLIHGVWGVLSGVFGNVGQAWHDVWQAINDTWHAAGKLAGWIYSALYHLFHVVIPGVVRWADRQFHNIMKWVEGIYDWVVHELDTLRKWVDHLIAGVLHWVTVHVWNPIWHSLTLAWKWIAHEGFITWYYISNPGKLASLLLDSLVVALEREAWRLGPLLGRFFLAMLAHNLKRFVLMLEDIIMAVL